MSINLTDEIEVKTKKGKLGAAKQIFLEGDTQTVEKEIQDINSRHNALNTKHESLSKTVQGIAATGGASTATNVTYDNTNSGMTAENIQDAVDNLAKEKADSSDVTKQLDKVTIKDEDGTVVDTPFRYIQNEEFIFAKVDVEDKLLFGIQWDGTPVFGKTSKVEDELQEQITILAEKVAAIIGDEDITSTIDTLNELKTFFANIENTQSLTDILANLDNVANNLDKTTIKDEEGNVQDTPFRVIENEEFIMAVVDSENRVLFGIYRAIGKPYYPLNDMYHIYHNDEFLWVILDAANHPLLGIKEDGTCWAAKAQWLDDIKAIKEALSSIDETLKTFQPKEDGKGLINLDVADSFFYISNDEYIIAVVDAENRILAGIKYDAQPYFPNHEMYSVITDEEWLYAIIDAEDKVLGGFRADDGHMVVGGMDISTFIANAIINIEDIKKRTAHLSTIDNDEYLSIETDADGKVIGYIAPDGSHYLYNVKSETIPTEFSHIEDPEERMEITTDAEDKVMSYRDANGKKHEHDMEVTNLEVSNLNLQGNSVNNIQDALKANGFDVKTPIDWSDKDNLEIPEPRCAYINITSSDGTAATWPTTKTANKKYWMQFWDMQGNYFKKRIILNAQGNSSMSFIKKNGAIDICNDEWIGDDTFKVKFGDWLAFDSFHLKAYYTDFFKGVSVMAYKLADEVELSRDVLVNRPWKRQLLAKYTFGTDQTNSAQVNDLSLQLDNEAKCHPDAFPCIVYLDNEFYGIYAFSIKKHRDNYHLDKGTAENIHLDGNLDGYDIWNGTINWSSFEIRNPKNLYYKEAHNGSYKYDADVAQAEIAGDDEVNAWIAAGKLPDGTKISSKIEKRLKITAKVKNYIIRASKALAIINAETDLTEKKTLFESYFDAPSLIDYEIIQMATGDTDGLSKNWQWITLDGNHWSVCEYDKDMSFGGYFTGEFTQSAPLQGGWMGNNSRTPLGLTISLYKDDIVSMWKKLTNNNVLTADNIISIADDWIKRIGTDNYKKEYKKWNEAPCCRADLVDTKHWKRSNEHKYGTEYNTYNSTKTYAVGDTCYYGFDNAYMFTAIAETTGNPPITGSYNYNPKGLGYYDSFWRLANYIKQRISVENNFINLL